MDETSCLPFVIVFNVGLEYQSYLEVEGWPAWLAMYSRINLIGPGRCVQPDHASSWAFYTWEMAASDGQTACWVVMTMQ